MDQKIKYTEQDLKDVLISFMSEGCPNTREKTWLKWFEAYMNKKNDESNEH